MKEFENENFTNDQNNEPAELPREEKTEVELNPQGEVHTPKTDMYQNNAPNPEQNSAPNSYSYSENGYNARREYAERPYAQQNQAYGYTQNPYSTPSYEMPNNNGYVNNSYGSYGAGYDYSKPNDSAYNPYQKQYDGYNAGYSEQNGGYGNYYVPNYDAPRQDGGNISYTPNNVKPKKEKQKKSVSRTAFILVCCLTVALSGFCAFVGTAFANKIAQINGSSSGLEIIGGENSGDGTVVIYKGLEDVDSSVDKADGEKLSYEDVAATVKDSVVEITTEYNMQSMWYQYVTEGAGSGVIITEEGHIITNNHVICDDETGQIADSIKVRLTNGLEYTAAVVGTDAISDIAILKINATNLTVAVCGNSDELAVGEELIIVGNPLGSLGGTVTNGIVSATERTIQVNSVDMTLIQTNAAVNPGNSGGGMFNMMGQLVGIVNAKSSGTGIEGLGFAIPVNEALSVTEQLLEYGYVRGRVTIGVTFYEVSNSSFFQGYYGLKNGVYVSELEKGYNDNVLNVGDRIIAVNGTEITTSADIKNIYTAASVGDILEFQLYRNGKLLTIDVTCYESVPSDIESSVQFQNGTEYPTGTIDFGN